MKRNIQNENRLKILIIILLSAILLIAMISELQKPETSLFNRIAGYIFIIVIITGLLSGIYVLYPPKIIQNIFARYIMPSKILFGLLTSIMIMIILGGFGTVLSFMPNINNPSILGIIITWFFTIIIAIFRFRNIVRKSKTNEFMTIFNFTNLMMAGAIHFLLLYISTYLIFVLLVGVYLIAWALPFINLLWAKAIVKEQYAPKTFIGNMLTRYSLVVVFLLVIISGILFDNVRNLDPRFLFMGLLLGWLSIGMAQVFSLQIYESDQ
jgi:hypothetical protein